MLKFFYVLTCRIINTYCTAPETHTAVWLVLTFWFYLHHCSLNIIISEIFWCVKKLFRFLRQWYKKWLIFCDVDCTRFYLVILKRFLYSDTNHQVFCGFMAMIFSFIFVCSFWFHFISFKHCEYFHIKTIQWNLCGFYVDNQQYKNVLYFVFYCTVKHIVWWFRIIVFFTICEI